MPRIGRPPTADADRIAVAALRLFAERGYDSSTMADVATAAGVSRSTLFRFYATKGDLVWGGLPAANDRFLAAWHSAAQHELSGLRAAFVAAFTLEAAERETARLRLRLIAATPSLQTVGWTRQRESAAMLRDALAGVWHERDPFLLDVAAATIASAVNAALMRWAQGSADDLAARVDEALRMLEDGLVSSGAFRQDLAQ